MLPCRTRPALCFSVRRWLSKRAEYDTTSTTDGKREKFIADEISKKADSQVPPLLESLVSARDTDGITFDTIVVGGGHAGSEAAAASARMGGRTLLVTQKISTVGEMSCNPSIGGIGKGHLVRELDALDGLMGKAIDNGGIHFRMLNTSKGPAVWGPRAQADRSLYKQYLQEGLANLPGNKLQVLEASVLDISLDESRTQVNSETERLISKIDGVVVEVDGIQHFIKGKTVILTTGTFLGGMILLGTKRFEMGRFGDRATSALSKTLARFGFPLGRLKTGTPPRLDRNTIDYSQTEIQQPDRIPFPFSFCNDSVQIPPNKQLNCHITYTNDEVHEIVRANGHLSPYYYEEDSPGSPRYCPSLETKVQRFAHRPRHQIFLEPEGVNSDYVYPAGVSNCLPEEVQKEFLQKIPGLQNVRIVRPGYAVAYDFVEPRSLWPSLETKSIAGLFLAGQINGTTGYEEAAVQGLMAGINAKILAQEDVPVPATHENRVEKWFCLDRADGYTGVLIDDLITRGVDEPYRMFTSRAEYRLSLRADNADERLTRLGAIVGCVSNVRLQRLEEKQKRVQEVTKVFQGFVRTPNEWTKLGIPVSNDGKQSHLSGEEIMQRYRVSSLDLKRVIPHDLWTRIPDEIFRLLDIEAKYHSQIERQNQEIETFRRDETLPIPLDIDYDEMKSFLSTEEKEKLQKYRPASIGAASRISGLTPSSLILLLKFVKKRKGRKEFS